MEKIKVSQKINAPAETVWSVITDIENAVNTIRAINKVDILEKGHPFTGLKWKETRTMFGKEATEVMWIQKSEENSFYKVEAASHGSRYFTDFYLAEEGGSTTLTIEFSADIQSALARLMNFLMGWMFKKATVDAFRQDLDDIKKAAEEA